MHNNTSSINPDEGKSGFVIRAMSVLNDHWLQFHHVRYVDKGDHYDNHVQLGKFVPTMPAVECLIISHNTHWTPKQHYLPLTKLMIYGDTKLPLFLIRDKVDSQLSSLHVSCVEVGQPPLRPARCKVGKVINELVVRASPYDPSTYPLACVHILLVNTRSVKILWKTQKVF